MDVMIRELIGVDGEERAVTDQRFDSLSAAAVAEPADAAYLVARTWNGGKVLELDAHFDRLERSAATLGVPVRVPRRRVRDVLAEMRRTFPGTPEVRFRVTAVGAAAGDEPRFRLSMEVARELPADLREHGAVCALAVGTVRADASVKSTAWMQQRAMLPSNGGDAYETLLVRTDGAILEGASSNVYAILGDTLHTAGSGVLEGIARGIVLTVAERLAPDLTVSLEPPTLEDLAAGRVREAFLTSATRGVVPIRRIGNTGVPVPGIWTARIADEYGRWLRAHLEPLAD